MNDERKKIIQRGAIEFMYIEKWPGYYISKCGKVFSTKRNRLLSTHITRNGYERVSLSFNNKSYKFFVHQLVVSAYIGERPVGQGSETHIDHIDANKKNNHVSNLRIINRRDNVTKEMPKLLGANQNRSGKYMAQIRVNGWLQYLGSYDTPEQAHSRYKVARMMLSKSP